jgi:hypothetical protein
MAEQDAPLPKRLYAMMQALMIMQTPPYTTPSPPRGIVTKQDALDALRQVAIAIDEATQTGRMLDFRGWHAGSMLMVVRDYIQPLPAVIEGDRDRVTEDLEELVATLRQAESSGA